MIDDYYEITSEPAEEPVTLTEVKNWLRVDHSVDDTLITSLITSARKFGEKFCNRIFVNTSFDCFFSSLDSSACELYSYIQIRRAPLVSISSIETYNSGSYSATTDYLLKQTNGFSRVVFNNGLTYEYTTAYPIKISVISGYGTATDVPEDIKTALKAHIAFMYENRGDVVAEGKLSMPYETKAIYSGKYRILNTF